MNQFLRICLDNHHLENTSNGIPPTLQTEKKRKINTRREFMQFLLGTKKSIVHSHGSILLKAKLIGESLLLVLYLINLTWEPFGLKVWTLNMPTLPYAGTLDDIILKAIIPYQETRTNSSKKVKELGESSWLILFLTSISNVCEICD